MQIPTRKNKAREGSLIANSLLGIQGAARENAITTELLEGNIPDLLRNSVHVAAVDEEMGYSLTYTVLPRFLAIGTNEDHFYVPMTPTAAQVVADSWGAVLPTYKMVQDIFKFTSFRQIATTFKAGPQMVSTEWFKKHSDIVVKQLEKVPHQALCDGYKKNVIISKSMETKKNSVFIYGWMKDQDGNFWQGLPLYAGHSRDFSDYSHGIRLIDRKMMLSNMNDETSYEVDAYDLLKDGKLSSLLSAEGPITIARY